MGVRVGVRERVGVRVRVRVRGRWEGVELEVRALAVWRGHEQQRLVGRQVQRGVHLLRAREAPLVGRWARGWA